MMAVLFFVVGLLQMQPDLVADTAVVARVGSAVITAQDLQDSYTFGPAFVKRLPGSLQRHLQFMIYERLLAQQAEAMQMDTTSFVRERVEALEEDLTVDQLYRHEILDRVIVGPEEKERGLREARVNLRLRWIYAQTKNGIQRFRQQLARGASFDSLFARSLPDSADPSSRSLETTLLKLRRDNPVFAEHVGKLRTMEASEPIRGPDGFYIVRIDELWQNPLQTETAAAHMAEDAEQLLRMIKADVMAGEYVRDKMAAAHPVIKAEGYDIVRAYLADRALSRETKLAWNIPSSFMTEAGPQPIRSSGRFLNRPLVTFAGQLLTVRDFARWYDIRQFQIKVSSLQAFNNSVRGLIWRMVQDRLLSQEAYGRGLQRERPVTRETKEWRTKLLYLAARARLDRSITISEAAVKQRYEEYRRRWGERKRPLPPMKEIRQAIFEELFVEHEREALHQLLDELRRRYPVQLSDSVVRRLASGVARDPEAIDMMMYKPGGTFPRVAYPSIDDRWQQFR